MATNNSVWNGIFLGSAFAGLLAFFVQSKVPLIWSSLGTLSNKIISSWSGFSMFSTDVMSYLIFIIIGLFIGWYVEKK